MTRDPAASFRDGEPGAPLQAMNVGFFDPTFKADPHPVYATLRTHAPMHRMLNRDGRPMWLVTRHDHVLQVLKDARFIKDRLAVLTADERAQQPPLPPAMRYLARHMLALDPPQHTRLRRLVLQAFAPRTIEALRPRVQQLADQLLDRVLSHGAIELIDDYAFPLPITVICELLGVPASDRALFRDWSTVLITHIGALDARTVGLVVPVLDALALYMAELFQRKRQAPGNDLTTRLLQARDGDDVLSEDELIAMLLLLIVAGHETTTHLIGNGVLTLLQHPAQLRQLRRDPALLPQAIEEMLRHSGPIETSTLRYASRDMTFAGADLRRGDLVMVVLSAANRDPSCFARADQFDIDRGPLSHLALGHGIHFCLGAALARMEAEVAIGTLLRRLPALRLAVAPAQLSWRVGPLIRGLVALPLTFDGGAAATPGSPGMSDVPAPADAPAATGHGTCPVHPSTVA